MGADLLTRIVTGPTKLKANARLRAKMLKQAKLIVSACNQAGKDPDFDWRNDPIIGHLAATMEVENLDAIACLDPKATLAALFEIWNGAGEARDVSSRVSTIGGQEFAIVVAGDMSWGDEPDGFGYLTLRDAEHLGFFGPLGIK